MLVNYNKILYCTDLSENAFHAFRHAISLATQLDSEVHILHVVEALSADAKLTLRAFIMNSADRHEALDERLTYAKKNLQLRLDKCLEELDEKNQNVRDRLISIDVVESYPAEQILKSAESYNCDLIVMGAHEKGLTHNFLGSVAKSVLRRSNIPTLIVPLP